MLEMYHVRRIVPAKKVAPFIVTPGCIVRRFVDCGLFLILTVEDEPACSCICPATTPEAWVSIYLYNDLSKWLWQSFHQPRNTGNTLPSSITLHS